MLCLLKDDNNNPIIIRPHIVFTDDDNPVIIRPHIVLTDEDNDNPIIMRPHIVFTDGRQRQPNHNTTTYCVY